MFVICFRKHNIMADTPKTCILNAIKFTILLFLSTQTITAQEIVYLTKWKSEADVDIILVDRKINANGVV